MERVSSIQWIGNTQLVFACQMKLMLPIEKET